MYEPLATNDPSTAVNRLEIPRPHKPLVGNTSRDTARIRMRLQFTLTGWGSIQRQEIRLGCFEASPYGLARLNQMCWLLVSITTG